MSRHPARLLLAALTMLTLAFVGMPSASADPIPPRPCSASSCNGQPPTNGCSTDEYYNPTWTSPPASNDGAGVINVYLRYSPWCTSNWARVTNSDGDSFRVVELMWVQNAYGNVGYTYVWNGGYGYSVMVDGSVAARACVRWYYRYDTNRYVACTGWY